MGIQWPISTSLIGFKGGQEMKALIFLSSLTAIGSSILGRWLGMLDDFMLLAMLGL
ncbi:hypothetical protein ABP1_3158 [Bacillus subtilis]|nr:hypothetical protein ABP1_3158 [Bacillus subtilis]